MPDDIIPRDDNNVTALAGITDDANEFIKALRVDPVTGRLKVSATISGGGTGILELNGLDASVQTFSKADDTNVTLTITSVTDDHEFALGWSGQLSLARGGTGANLADPNADRILFWDDSAGTVTWLTLGTNLSITDTTLNASGGGGSDLDVGTSVVLNGTSTRVLYNNAGVLGEYAITGSGNVVMSTSPTLVTPVLGTPTSVTLTNATGLPISTGISGLGTNVATALAINVGSAGAFVTLDGALGTPSSGNLANCTFPTLNQNTTGSAATLTTTRTIWGQNFNGSANVTGDITLGASSITMTGSIATTGSRVTKVWTTDIESTNMITIGGTSLTTVAQTLQNKTITNSNNVLGGITMTLGSDADGDTYYRSSNVLTRLAKGTAGQVLTMNAGATAPEWKTPSGGSGGATLIASGSLSGAAVSITDIPATYAYLALYINGASSNLASREIYVQVSTNNGSSYDTTTGNYPYKQIVSSTVSSATRPSLMKTESQTAAQTAKISLALYNYQGIGVPHSKWYVNSGASVEAFGDTYYLGSTSAINALQILFSGSGNFDAGTYALYGIS